MPGRIYQSQQVAASEVDVMQYRKEDGILGLMDCGGSNLVKINEQIPGIVKMIGTGRIEHPDVKARDKAKIIGDANGVGTLPLVELDFRAEEYSFGIATGDYYRAITKGKDAKMQGNIHNYQKVVEIRDNVCHRFLEMLYAKMDEKGIPRDIPVFAAGFMQLGSRELVEALKMKNVHPGDLTKHDLMKRILRGARTVVGDGWVPPAIAISAGHDNLCSSMHELTYEMDSGPMFMRGYPFEMDYNRLMSTVDISDKAVLKQVAEAAQEALKNIGDHVIAGATFQDLFDGNWGIHEPTGTYAYQFDGKWYLAPNGITAKDHEFNNPETPFKRTHSFIEDKVTEFWREVEEIRLKNK